MKRIHEIITDVKNRFPDDNFFSDFEKRLRNNEDIRKSYQAYGRALNELDDNSWQVLKDKALRHYKNHRDGQKKQGFFNQLNEAFAYRYLKKKGCNSILFLEEDGNKKPDIEYIRMNARGYCEVKTLGISDIEIELRASQAVGCSQAANYEYDYDCLKNGFLNKFQQAIDSSWAQINAMGQKGLVYIVINFDDSVLDNYLCYRKQLINYSRQQKFNDVFLKIGVRDNKRIGIFHKFSEPIGPGR
jgi:hypothetical protein